MQEQKLLSNAMLYLELLKAKYFPNTKDSDIDRLIEEYKQYVLKNE